MGEGELDCFEGRALDGLFAGAGNAQIGDFSEIFKMDIRAEIGGIGFGRFPCFPAIGANFELEPFFGMLGFEVEMGTFDLEVGGEVKGVELVGLEGEYLELRGDGDGGIGLLDGLFADAGDVGFYAGVRRGGVDGETADGEPEIFAFWGADGGGAVADLIESNWFFEEEE